MSPTPLVHNIDLTAVNDSQLVGVSVYPSRAEVTRVFKVSVKTGQNQITINGLPNVLDKDSLRVEGRGVATISDVTVASMPELPKPSTSPTLDALVKKRESTFKVLERYKKMNGALEKYLSTLHVDHVPAGDVKTVLNVYHQTGEEIDEKMSSLESELVEIGEDIQKERQISEKSAGSASPQDKKRFLLRTRVSINIHTDAEGEIEFLLTYAVTGASWDATYDVRVDTRAEEAPVSLVYKAKITQNTGEDWRDVPLTLETASATYETGIPNLRPWTLSAMKPAQPFGTPIGGPHPSGGFFGTGLPAPPSAFGVFGSSVSVPTAPPATQGAPTQTMPPMSIRTATAPPKGNVSATFTIPGHITIPSDGAAHTVTIASLELEATLSWVAVPAYDDRTRISARIKNASEYTLLSGASNIYVDGSFISKTKVPDVSVEESFDLPLGLDSAIKITYRPASKKKGQVALFNKPAAYHYSYTRNILIHNTKPTAIKLRIMDQIPVSKDESIIVKLISPALPAIDTAAEPKEKSGGLPWGNSSPAQSSIGSQTLKSQVQVSPGIVAQWGDGTDNGEAGDKPANVGQDGTLSWVCEIKPKQEVALLLQWEAMAPMDTTILGFGFGFGF